MLLRSTNFTLATLLLVTFSAGCKTVGDSSNTAAAGAPDQKYRQEFRDSAVKMFKGTYGSPLVIKSATNKDSCMTVTANKTIKWQTCANTENQFFHLVKSIPVTVNSSKGKVTQTVFRVVSRISFVGHFKDHQGAASLEYLTSHESGLKLGSSEASNLYVDGLDVRGSCFHALGKAEKDAVITRETKNESLEEAIFGDASKNSRQLDLSSKVNIACAPQATMLSVQDCKLKDPNNLLSPVICQ